MVDEQKYAALSANALGALAVLSAVHTNVVLSATVKRSQRLPLTSDRDISCLSWNASQEKEMESRLCAPRLFSFS